MKITSDKIEVGDVFVYSEKYESDKMYVTYYRNLEDLNNKVSPHDFSKQSSDRIRYEILEFISDDLFTYKIFINNRFLGYLSDYTKFWKAYVKGGMLQIITNNSNKNNHTGMIQGYNGEGRWL